MKISIIMCAKDSMPYIISSIKSFQKQNYKDKELIVVYSKGKDTTNQYLNSLNEKNIKIYNFEGSIYHQLQIISQDNVSYLAMYSLVKDNGEWKISGCSIYPMNQQSI